MKTSKIFLLSALSFFFTLGFMYLVWAFVIMDINAFNWSYDDRAYFVIFGCMFSIIPCAIVAMILDEKK